MVFISNVQKMNDFVPLFPEKFGEFSNWPAVGRWPPRPPTHAHLDQLLRPCGPAAWLCLDTYSTSGVLGVESGSNKCQSLLCESKKNRCMGGSHQCSLYLFVLILSSLWNAKTLLYISFIETDHFSCELYFYAWWCNFLLDHKLLESSGHIISNFLFSECQL